MLRLPTPPCKRLGQIRCGSCLFSECESLNSLGWGCSSRPQNPPPPGHIETSYQVVFTTRKHGVPSRVEVKIGNVPCACTNYHVRWVFRGSGTCGHFHYHRTTLPRSFTGLTFIYLWQTPRVLRWCHSLVSYICVGLELGQTWKDTERWGYYGKG